MQINTTSYGPEYLKEMVFNSRKLEPLLLTENIYKLVNESFIYSAEQFELLVHAISEHSLEMHDTPDLKKKRMANLYNWTDQSDLFSKEAIKAFNYELQYLAANEF